MTCDLRLSGPGDAERVIEIWRSAVDATHDFLSAEDRLAIDEEVHLFLPQASLWLAIDGNGLAVGFMGLSPGQIDALFIEASHRGHGVGRRLVDHATSLQSPLQVDVNEQNLQAIGFYGRLGFEQVGRSPMDDQLRPYPLIHMKRCG